MENDIEELNTRISSLENHNIRLKLTKNLATEALGKSSQTTEQPNPTTSKPNAQTCSFENSGVCRRRNCGFFHPVGTCISFSKVGSCSNPSTCNLRHPNRMCFEFQRLGSCRRGDECRFRHPAEHNNITTSSNPNSFLGYGQTNQRHQNFNYNTNNQNNNFPGHLNSRYKKVNQTGMRQEARVANQNQNQTLWWNPQNLRQQNQSMQMTSHVQPVHPRQF